MVLFCVAHGGKLPIVFTVTLVYGAYFAACLHQLLLTCSSDMMFTKTETHISLSVLRSCTVLLLTDYSRIVYGFTSCNLV